MAPSLSPRPAWLPSYVPAAPHHERRRLGKYALDGVLGTSHSGALYRGEPDGGGRMVALKVLRKHGVAPAIDLARFLDEAQALSELSHPHVVRVVDSGVLPDGRGYLASELVEGESLTEILQRMSPLPYQLALTMAEQLLAALAAVHARELTHGNLKASNVMLTVLPGALGHATLVDFGFTHRNPLALGLQNVERLPDAARHGVAAYLSPEQACGQEATPASDLYSLGAVLFEALTGRVPFPASSPFDAIRAQVTLRAPRVCSLIDVTPAVDSFVAWLLEKKPSERPASAAHALTMLRIARREADGIVEPHTTIAYPVVSPPVPVPELASEPVTPAKTGFVLRIHHVAVLLAIAIVSFGTSAMLWLQAAPVPAQAIEVASPEPEVSIDPAVVVQPARFPVTLQPVELVMPKPVAAKVKVRPAAKPIAVAKKKPARGR